MERETLERCTQAVTGDDAEGDLETGEQPEPEEVEAPAAETQVEEDETVMENEGMPEAIEENYVEEEMDETEEANADPVDETPEKNETPEEIEKEGDEKEAELPAHETLKYDEPPEDIHRTPDDAVGDTIEASEQLLNVKLGRRLR